MLLQKTILKHIGIVKQLIIGTSPSFWKIVKTSTSSTKLLEEGVLKLSSIRILLFTTHQPSHLPTQELIYPNRSKEISSQLNQPNYLKLFDNFLSLGIYSRLTKTTILDYLRHLFRTNLDNYLRLSYATWKSQLVKPEGQSQPSYSLFFF